MKRRAVCPVCGTGVPRWWYVRRATRACRRCATPIRSRLGPDVAVSVANGVGTVVLMGVGTWVGAVLGDGGPVGPLTGMGTAFVLGLTIGAVLYPYTTPFERRHAAPGCRCCGYDCRATPARCPECGAERPV